MSAFCLTVLAVLIGDQTVKHVIRRLPGRPVVAGRLWLLRVGGPFGGVTMWSIWAAATATLVIAGRLASIDPILVGLLVGGSLSHAVESSLRGSVTDYMCVRNLAFDLADLALATGALGIVGTLLGLMPRQLA